ncbi:MAG: RidA family protein [Chloroflexi bacterium]|nr:RidA family protein [Chloroflexota bacterium]
MAKLTPRPQGNFSYLPGSGTYCRGVVADKGYTLAHATLRTPLPLAQGFKAIAEHLASIGRPAEAFCGAELRIAEPFTAEAFATFNTTYIKLLDKHGLRDGENATATRTNVAISGDIAPKSPSVFAFAYTIPGVRTGGRKSFIGSGLGEGKIQVGKSTPKAMAAKAADVMGALNGQLESLGTKWSDVSHTTMYTVRSVDSYVHTVVLAGMGPAARNGLHWFFAAPPILDLEFEVDIRGVAQELFL